MRDSRRYPPNGKVFRVLGRHPYFASAHDLDQTKRLVASRYCGHEMSLVERGSLDAWMNARSVRGLDYSAVGYGLASVVSPGRTEKFYPIMIPISGGGTVRVGKEEVAVSSRTAAVVSATEPLRMELTGDCTLIILCVSRDALERYAADVIGEPVTAPLTFTPGMNLAHGRASRWYEQLLGDIEDLDSPDSLILANEHAARAAEWKLLTSLLLSQPHSYSEKLTAVRLRTASGCIVRAVDEYIEAYPELPHTPADLAVQANCSVRALQKAFKINAGQTPMLYLRERRLRWAREKLTEAQPGAITVAAIAASCGFTHLGRFAKEYKKRFGEAPSATLRRC